MSLNYSVGPALSAELAYRQERIADAARGTRRVRRSRARRGARAVLSGSATALIGLAHPAR